MSKFAIAIVAALVIATGHVLTAPAAGTRGEGAAGISGYTVSSVHYVPRAGDPSQLAAVSFDISPATATSVRAKVRAAGGTWYQCTNDGGHVVCPTTSGSPVRIAAVDVLGVEAVG
jgi:hypothetical protein